MKILMINLHSSHNAGDHVLLEVALQQIYTHFPGCAITLAMNDPDSYADRPDAGDEAVVDSFFAWFKRKPAARGFSRWRERLGIAWALGVSVLAAALYRLLRIRADSFVPAGRRATVRAYLAADLVISCAGNFLYSRGHSAGLPLLGPVFTIAYAWLAGKPVAMLPQTVGPLWRDWERRLVRWLLGRVRTVLVRDVTSVELLQRMGVPAERYRLTPDLAFLYTIPDHGLGRTLLCRYGIKPDQPRPLLGVTVINWGAQHPRFKEQARYEAAVAAAIRHFVTAYGGRAVLFAQVCGPTAADDDRIPARRVCAALAQHGLAGRVTLVDEEVAAPTLKAAYGCMDLFLGSRLHSNIFALTEGVPVLAIAYQDKTFGVLRMLDLAAWAVDIHTVTPAALVDRLAQLWDERIAVRALIVHQLGPLQAEAGRTMEWLHKGQEGA
jgi:colanic acid/amylovoran biosynthesis protein